MLFKAYHELKVYFMIQITAILVGVEFSRSQSGKFFVRARSAVTRLGFQVDSGTFRRD